VSGLLVLVVGPSGSGKDTVLAGAAAILAKDPRFRFARRVITRPAAQEDSETTDVPTFLARRNQGCFALNWEAHGLHYGIPADIAGDIAAGRVVVANVSRSVLADAAARFPSAVIEVTAPPSLRADRLARRGRETAADIAERLARDVPRPAGLHALTVINDGSIDAGVATFADCLRRLAG
jgi:ribose 1,5-bisphosphokinase